MLEASEPPGDGRKAAVADRRSPVASRRSASGDRRLAIGDAGRSVMGDGDRPLVAVVQDTHYAYLLIYLFTLFTYLLTLYLFTLLTYPTQNNVLIPNRFAKARMLEC